MKHLLAFVFLSLLAGKALHSYRPAIQAALGPQERMVIQNVPASPEVLTEPRGKLLLVIDWSVGIQFWDTQTESLLGQLPCPAGVEWLAPVLAPDGRHLIWASRHQDDRDLFSFLSVDLDDIAQWPPKIKKIGSCRSHETISRLSFPGTGETMKAESWGNKATCDINWQGGFWTTKQHFPAPAEIKAERHPKKRIFHIFKGPQRVFDLPIGQGLPGYTEEYDARPVIALNSDSTLAAVGWPLGDHDAVFEVWDVRKAQRLMSQRLRGIILNISHCPRSNRFFFGTGASKYDSAKGGVFVVDNPSAPKVRKFPQDRYVEAVHDARFDESGRKFFTKSVNGTTTFWDVESLTLSHQLPLEVADGGSDILVRSSDNGSMWINYCDFDVDTKGRNPTKRMYEQFLFDPEGRCVGSGALTGKGEIEGFYFQQATGNVLRVDTRAYHPLYCNSADQELEKAARQAGFHPAFAEPDYAVYQRDGASSFAASQGLKWLAWHEEKTATIQFHSWGAAAPPATITGISDVSSLDLHPSLPLLLVGTRSRSTRLLNLATRQTVFLVAHTAPDPDWIAFSEDGFFDASKRGASLVSVVRGTQAWQIDQFLNERNRPDILLDRLGLLTREKKQMLDLVLSQRDRKAQKFNNVAIKKVDMPDVRLESISPDRHMANILVSHPLAERVDLRVNGTFFQRVSLPQANLAVKVAAPLLGGFNRIEAEAVTPQAEHSARSHLTAWGEQPKDDRTLIVAMGVSEYLDETQEDLVYPAKDARDLAAALEKASASSKTESLVLTDSQMTKGALEKVQAFIASARPADTVIIFMAGHGLQQDGSYYFLTHDTNTSNVRDSSISFNDLEKVLKECRSLKKLVLLDTCYSGEASIPPSQNSNTQKSSFAAAGPAADPATTQKTAARLFLDRRLLSGDVLRRSGAIVFSACLAHEVSGEDDNLQQGIFTHALLRALNTVATDTDEDRRITVRELARSVSSFVTAYTHGQQHPAIDRDNHLLEIEFLVTEDVPDSKTIGSILLNLRALVDDVPLTDEDTRKPLFASTVNYLGKMMSASSATKACRSSKRPFSTNGRHLSLHSNPDKSVTLDVTADGILKGARVWSWCTVTLRKAGQHWLVSGLEEKLASP